jgi:hypothetical protein
MALPLLPWSSKRIASPIRIAAIIAMISPAAEQGGNGQPWQRFPTPAPPGYVYLPSSNYNDGYGQR